MMMMEALPHARTQVEEDVQTRALYPLDRSLLTPLPPLPLPASSCKSRLLPESVNLQRHVISGREEEEEEEDSKRKAP
jgi:hypothetical protein